MASRLHASYVSILQRFSDVVAIYLSLYIYFNFNNLRIDNQTLVIFLALVCVFQLFAGITDFYRSWRGSPLRYELLSCVKNVVLTGTIFYFLSLFSNQVSAELILQVIVLASILITAFRIIIRIAYAIFFKIFEAQQRVLVIGNSKRARELHQNLRASQWMGAQVLGLFYFNQPAHASEDFLGGIEEVKRYVQQGNINKVYIVIDQKNLKQVEDLLEFLSDSTCSTIIVPELFSYNYLYSRVEDIHGIPLIPLFDTRLDGINNLLKRTEDIVVASCILCLISPLLLIIALAIKFNSKGPVLFKQERYGLNAKPILVYKFRTMTVMENGADVKQATRDDPRVTRVGRILRRTSLDELPQFFNVLIGNMSVVGPRPHAVAHNEAYRKLISGYMLRHKVKPGITGLAQIRGWRGETDTLDKMEKRIESDLDYIRHWSLWLDIRIIFLTVFYGFIHKAAY